MRRFSPELCERAIGVVLDREGGRDAGRWPGPAGDERERIRTPEREVRQANGILRKALAYFARAELDRPHKR